MKDEDVIPDIEQARRDRRYQLQRIEEMSESELLDLESLIFPDPKDETLEVNDRKVKLTEEEWDFVKAMHPSAWSRIKRKFRRA